MPTCRTQAFVSVRTMTNEERAFNLVLDVSENADIASPMEVIVVLKYLDSEGKPNYIACSTPTLMTVEAIGMLTYGSDFLRRDLQKDDE